MPRRITALAACAAVVAVALSGCGSKAPGIPRSDASELISLLRTAQREADDPQKCSDLLGTVRDLNAKVAGLPSATDRDVRDSLSNGVRNLGDTARSQCAKTQTTPTTPTVPTTPTTPPPTTDSTPTTPPPTTNSTPTTPTQSTPTTPPTTPNVPTTPGTGGQAPGNNGNGVGNGNKPKKPKKPKTAKGAGHGGKHR